MEVCRLNSLDRESYLVNEISRGVGAILRAGSTSSSPTPTRPTRGLRLLPELPAVPIRYGRACSIRQHHATWVRRKTFHKSPQIGNETNHLSSLLDELKEIQEFSINLINLYLMKYRVGLTFVKGFNFRGGTIYER